MTAFNILKYFHPVIFQQIYFLIKLGSKYLNSFASRFFSPLDFPHAIKNSFKMQFLMAAYCSKVNIYQFSLLFPIGHLNSFPFPTTINNSETDIPEQTSHLL